MRKVFLLLFSLIFSSLTFSQNAIPSVRVQDLNGKWIQSDQLATSGKPLIVSFWATWCKPCLKELNAIYEILPDWQKATGVELVAVSIDDSRSSSKVAPFVSSRGWDFKVVLDVNGDFKRALNVINVPHTFLYDAKGNLFWQHTTYAEGDEAELYRKIKEAVKKVTIEK
ncbi:MAG: TlpA disulfide reductase family protein [Bacteroidia bacterium]|nr:TlpA disulfide reductase family protein [Bacteroidia bacterium]